MGATFSAGLQFEQASVPPAVLASSVREQVKSTFEAWRLRDVSAALHRLPSFQAGTFRATWDEFFDTMDSTEQARVRRKQEELRAMWHPACAAHAMVRRPAEAAPAGATSAAVSDAASSTGGSSAARAGDAAAGAEADGKAEGQGDTPADGAAQHAADGTTPGDSPAGGSAEADEAAAASPRTPPLPAHLNPALRHPAFFGYTDTTRQQEREEAQRGLEAQAQLQQSYRASKQAAVDAIKAERAAVRQELVRQREEQAEKLRLQREAERHDWAGERKEAEQMLRGDDLKVFLLNWERRGTAREDRIVREEKEAEARQAQEDAAYAAESKEEFRLQRELWMPQGHTLTGIAQGEREAAARALASARSALTAAQAAAERAKTSLLARALHGSATAAEERVAKAQGEVTRCEEQLQRAEASLALARVLHEREARYSPLFFALMDAETREVDVMEAMMVVALSSGATLNEKLEFCFRTFDLNSSKTLSLDEMMVMITALARAMERIGGLERGVPAREMESLAVQAFAEADADRNGVLTEFEFRAWASALVHRSLGLSKLFGVPWRHAALSQHQRAAMGLVHQYRLGLLSLPQLQARLRVHREVTRFRPCLAPDRRRMLHARALARGADDPLKPDYTRLMQERRRQRIAGVNPLSHGALRNVLEHQEQVRSDAATRIQALVRGKQGRKLAAMAKARATFMRERDVALQRAQAEAEAEIAANERSSGMRRMKWEAHLRTLQLRMVVGGKMPERKQVLAEVVRERVEAAVQEMVQHYDRKAAKHGVPLRSTWLQEALAIPDTPLDPARRRAEEMARKRVARAMAGRPRTGDAARPRTSASSRPASADGVLVADDGVMQLDKEARLQSVALGQAVPGGERYGELSQEITLRVELANPDSSMLALANRLALLCPSLTPPRFLRVARVYPTKRLLLRYATTFSSDAALARHLHSQFRVFPPANEELAVALRVLAATDQEMGVTDAAARALTSVRDEALELAVAATADAMTGANAGRAGGAPRSRGASRHRSILAAASKDRAERAAMRARAEREKTRAQSELEQATQLLHVASARAKRARDAIEAAERAICVVDVTEGMPGAFTLLRQVTYRHRCDWSARMCLAMEALRQAPREAWALREVTTVIADFVDCARHYAELIAREIGLPDHLKSLPPDKSRSLDLLPFAGGQRFMACNIRLRLVADEEGVYNGSDDAAAKAAANALRHAAVYRSLGLQGVHVPLCALVDALGFRVLAVALLPLSLRPQTQGAGQADVLFEMGMAGGEAGAAGEGKSNGAPVGEAVAQPKYDNGYDYGWPGGIFDHTVSFRSNATKVSASGGGVSSGGASGALGSLRPVLLRGSPDKGDSFIFDQDAQLEQQMDAASRVLNLARHYVTAKRLARPAYVSGAATQLVFVGRDGRKHMLGFERALPPEDPRATPHLSAVDRGLSILWRMLRPELVRSLPQPVSPDALTSFTFGVPDCASQSEAALTAATALVRQRVSEFAREVLEWPTAAVAAVPWEEEMHRRGINMRHLGWLRLQFWRELSGAASAAFGGTELRCADYNPSQELLPGCTLRVTGEGHSLRTRVVRTTGQGEVGSSGVVVVADAWPAGSASGLRLEAGEVEVQGREAANEEARRGLLTQLIGRALKHVLRGAMRAAARSAGVGSGSAAEEAVLQALNTLTGANGIEVAQRFWTDVVAPVVMHRFGRCALSWRERGDLLSAALPVMDSIVGYVTDALGLLVPAATLEKLRQSPRHFVFVPADLRRGLAPAAYDTGLQMAARGALLEAEARRELRRTYRDLVHESNPQAHWPMDDGAAATLIKNTGRLGSAAHARVVNGSDLDLEAPAFVHNDHVPFGTRAIRFHTKSRARLDCGPIKASFLADGARSVSLEVWACAESVVNAPRVLVGWGRAAIMITMQNRWAFRLFHVPLAVDVFAEGPAIVPGRWDHVVGTYDGLFVRLYVNGEQASCVLLQDAAVGAAAAQATRRRRQAAETMERLRTRALQLQHVVPAEVRQWVGTEEGAQRLQSETERIIARNRDEMRELRQLVAANAPLPPAGSLVHEQLGDLDPFAFDVARELQLTAAAPAQVAAAAAAAEAEAEAEAERARERERAAASEGSVLSMAALLAPAAAEGGALPPFPGAEPGAAAGGSAAAGGGAGDASVQATGDAATAAATQAAVSDPDAANITPDATATGSAGGAAVDGDAAAAGTATADGATAERGATPDDAAATPDDAAATPDDGVTAGASGATQQVTDGMRKLGRSAASAAREAVTTGMTAVRARGRNKVLSAPEAQALATKLLHKEFVGKHLEALRRDRDEMARRELKYAEAAQRRAATPLRFGCASSSRPAGAKHHFHGSMQHAALYTTALSGTVVSEHHRFGTTPATHRGARLLADALCCYEAAMRAAPFDTRVLLTYSAAVCWHFRVCGEWEADGAAFAQRVRAALHFFRRSRSPAGAAAVLSALPHDARHADLACEALQTVWDLRGDYFVTHADGAAAADVVRELPADADVRTVTLAPPLEMLRELPFSAELVYHPVTQPHGRAAARLLRDVLTVDGQAYGGVDLKWALALKSPHALLALVLTARQAAEEEVAAAAAATAEAGTAVTAPLKAESVVDLTECPDVTDEDMDIITDKRRGMETLCLRACTQLSQAAFRRAAHRGKFLRSVTLQGLPWLGDAGVAALADKCVDLRELTLRGCEGVTDEGVLALTASCTRLQALRLDGCTRVGDAAVVSVAQRLPFLRALGLGWASAVTDEGCMALAEAGWLGTSLTELSLQHCPLVTQRGVCALTERLSAITSLTIAHCERVGAAGAATATHKLVGLTSLSLAGVPAVTDTALVHTPSVDPRAGAQRGMLRQLVELDVGECTLLTDGALESVGDRCAALRRLVLRGCTGVTDGGVARLGREPGSDLPRLQELLHLDLAYCSALTDAALRTVADTLPQLHSLSVAGVTALSEPALLHAVRRLRRLQSLDVALVRSVTDECMRSMAQHLLLETLDLTHCKRVTDEGVQAVARAFTVLRHLRMAWLLRVTDEAVAALATATCLEEVDVRGCDGVTDGAVQRLRHLRPRVRVLDGERQGPAQSARSHGADSAAEAEAEAGAQNARAEGGAQAEMAPAARAEEVAVWLAERPPRAGANAKPVQRHGRGGPARATRR